MSTQTFVRVTAEHIEQGVARNCERCPVALAVIDALDLTSHDAVEADCGYVNIYRPGETWHADMPPNAWTFVDDFDGGRPVGPISFRLTWHIAQDPERLS